jgi:hypothetical protein
MRAHIENRIETRLDHKAPALIKKLKNGTLYRARMVNYSSKGLYFETNSMLSPGEEVDIAIENSPYIQASNVLDCYRAKIIWRKDLEPGIYKYGYGLTMTSGSKVHEFMDSR